MWPLIIGKLMFSVVLLTVNCVKINLKISI